MLRRGLGRFHQAGGYSNPPQTVAGSPGFNWNGLVKFCLVGGAAVVLAKATAQTGQSSNAAARSKLSPQPAPPWAKYALGGAVAAPAIWQGAKRIYQWLDSLELSAPQALPPSTQNYAAPVVRTSEYQAFTFQDTQDWLSPLLTRPDDQPSGTYSDTLDPAFPAWSPPPDYLWQSLAPHPSVGVIVGRRGGGKSALGYRLLELQRDRTACYVVGPPSLRKLLPDWIGVVQDVADVPMDAVILIDEAYLLLHSRDSMSRADRTIGPLINLSRQRKLNLIFISQEARQIDVNILSQLDWVAIKELSEFSMEFERRELRRFTDKARAEFGAIQGDRCPWSWVYSEPADFSGMVKNKLASFWRPALSHAFANAGPSDADLRSSPKTGLRKGKRTAKAELKAKASAMREAGYSYSQIAHALGVSKGTVWNWLSEG